MKKVLLFSFMLLSALVTESWAQERTISGKVTSVDDGSTLPGVNVVLKGTTNGTITDVDGNFKLSVPAEGGTLVFSFVGLTSEEVAIGSRSVIDLTMSPDIQQLSEVVVTALGISREKASLGYSVQQVTGDDVNSVNNENFITGLSGKVAGLKINKSSSLGGSTNVILRGSNSFSGNNQVLFVVDGVLISNSNLNSTTQTSGGGGYDYGNAASDIDPASIASISVLKGATAAALYGSDASNGVILITTKKGTKREGIGVSLNHSTSFSKMDKSTFPEYQKEYGAGYGPYYGTTGGFYDVDIDGDGTIDLLPPAGEDASYGAAFDPNLMVYQWDAYYPEWEDRYLKASPWVAAENDANAFFETGVANVTNISLEGGNDLGSVRFGYTRDSRTGILPNSSIDRNILDLNASFNITEKLSVSGKVTYTRNEGKGRYGTGYDGLNVLQGFKQWFQANVDLLDQKEAYESTGKNITWNPNSNTNLTPHYFDNPYWVRYENYNTDKRNRMFSKVQANYQIADWISVMARFGIDSYSDLQEERMAVGSLEQPYYKKYQRSFEEYNNDLIVTFNRDLSDKISISGLVGGSIKNRKIISSRASTNGGLVVAGLYSLSNSVSALNPPTETDIHVRKVGGYGQLTFGYDNMVYVDLTGRRDVSSVLPEANNAYFYPSASLSFVFSEVLGVSWLDLGKIRGSWAKVKGDGASYRILNTFKPAPPLGSSSLFFVGGTPELGTSDTALNPELRPEETSEIEIGLETAFLNNRAGLDFSWYKKNTIDQIMTAQVSTASGFNFKWVNAGEMENKGIELSLYGSPVKTGDLEWQVNLNWAKNTNTVISLFENGENLLLYSQWSSAVNARKGEPYGTITDTDFVYTNGQKTVGSDGKYLRTSSTTEVIGNIQPDWTGGLRNTLSYKGLSFSFLLDMQKGGDILSWDMGFGLATGLYAETAGLNDLGNPLRDPVADGGGIIVPGVKEDGTVNDIRVDAGTYEQPYGYYGGSADTGGRTPGAMRVYDATYVKLREVSLSYTLPSSIMGKMPLNDVTVSAFGNNLWIISKNVPYGDPEYITSSGNIQGIQNGALPSTKNYGFSVSVKF